MGAGTHQCPKHQRRLELTRRGWTFRGLLPGDGDPLGGTVTHSLTHPSAAGRHMDGHGCGRAWLPGRWGAPRRIAAAGSGGGGDGAMACQGLRIQPYGGYLALVVVMVVVVAFSGKVGGESNRAAPCPVDGFVFLFRCV